MKMKRDIDSIRLLGRFLTRKSSLGNRFFVEEQEPFRAYWWYYKGEDELLFATSGNTACPWKSAWYTACFMNRNKLSKSSDIKEVFSYMENADNLIVKEIKV